MYVKLFIFKYIGQFCEKGNFDVSYLKKSGSIVGYSNPAHGEKARIDKNKGFVIKTLPRNVPVYV